MNHPFLEEKEIDLDYAVGVSSLSFPTARFSISSPSVSPVSLSLSLPNDDDDDANAHLQTKILLKTKTGQASERGDAPTHRRLPRRRGIREHF